MRAIGFTNPEPHPLVPESNTEHLDYYPSGWAEEIHTADYVEWSYDDDPTIRVRLDGGAGPGRYVVTSITGVNERGEEFVTQELMDLSEEAAFEAASALVYAMNGVAGRLSGVPEFNGDA